MPQPRNTSHRQNDYLALGQAQRHILQIVLARAPNLNIFLSHTHAIPSHNASNMPARSAILVLTAYQLLFFLSRGPAGVNWSLPGWEVRGSGDLPTIGRNLDHAPAALYTISLISAGVTPTVSAAPTMTRYSRSAWEAMSAANTASEPKAIQLVLSHHRRHGFGFLVFTHVLN